jgi:hypothetical protein
MRILGAVLVFALFPPFAIADDKEDVEKVVRRQLANYDNDRVINATTGTDFIRRVRSPAKHTQKPTFTPGAITVTVLKDVVWFHGVGTLALKTTDKKPVTDTRAIRVNGVMKRDEDDAWRAAGELLAVSVDDKQLAEDVKRTAYNPSTGPGILNGDKPLARAVERWITAHEFGKSASSGGTLAASGLATADHKTGAAAVTLAASWDKLNLRPVEIDAKLVTPTVGFVLAEVAYTTPKGALAHVVLGAVLAKEKDTWKWVSLSWSPAEWFPKPEFLETASEDPCGD